MGYEEAKLLKTGWAAIRNQATDLDEVGTWLTRQGVAWDTFDLRPLGTFFRAFRSLEEYASEYRIYGGSQEHCLWEKVLEHLVSFILVDPQPGMTAVDVGSCRSVAPAILRRVYGVRCYEQDLEYAAGVQGDRIGSSAEAIPLADGSVDFMTLHCTFEHFEGKADTGFIQECARLLKPGGKAVILPLYLNLNYVNITGETEAGRRAEIGWDEGADHFCLIPEWANRFGRHYSPGAFLERVHRPAVAAGLQPQLWRVKHWESLHPALWLRWILVVNQPALEAAEEIALG